MSDKKDAVNIGVSLSSQLIAAALAMITVVGAFAAFVLDKKIVGWVYYLIIISSFLSFVISIFFGGKGIDKARKDGYASNWNLDNTKNFFKFQALFAFIGIFLFIGSVFIGKEKTIDIQKEIEGQEKAISQLKFTDSLNQKHLLHLKNQIDSIQAVNSCKRTTQDCFRKASCPSHK